MNSAGNGALEGFGSNEKRLKTDRLAPVHTLGSVFPPPFKEKDLQLNLVTAAAQL